MTRATQQLSMRDRARVNAKVEAIHDILRDDDRQLEVPVDVERVAVEIGDLIIRRHDEGIAGHVRPNTTGKPISGLIDFERGVIHIDGREARVRQRFTIAHELAHKLLGHAALLDTSAHIESGWGNAFVSGGDSIAITDDPGDARQRMLLHAEAEADEFAGRLLIPRGELDAAIADQGPSVPVMAQHFEVSSAAMRRAMQPWLQIAAGPA